MTEPWTSFDRVLSPTGPGAGAFRAARDVGRDALRVALAWGVVAALLALAMRPSLLPAAETIRYEVAFEGLNEVESLASDIRALSSLVELRGKPPVALFALTDRARDDRERIRTFLRGEGYYAARIEHRIEENRSPVRVVLTIDAGPRYTLDAFDIVWKEPERPSPEPRLTPEDIGISPGAPGRAATIVEAQERLIGMLADRSFPFAIVADRRVVVDHAARTVSVTLTVDRGPSARFGETVIRGTERVDEGFVRRRIRWTRGEPFASGPVRTTREGLLGSGVFTSVRVEPDEDALGPDGEAPMVVSLRERARRTISFRAYYDTSLGPGGEVEWMHRNLFGGAERLTLRAGGTFVEYGASATFLKPDIFRGPQDLIAEARYHELDAPAYDGREAVAGIAIERRFGERFSVRAGPVADWSMFREGPTIRRFTLFGANLTGTWDGRDDRLNPTSGVWGRVDVRPYAGSGLSFAQAIGRINGYWTPVSGGRMTIAGWTRWGTVIGEDTARLPPNKRLFSGGGNSIRGFGFQRIGPLNAAGNPTGGRSLVELGLETRWRITEQWGAVAFVEGGNVFESSVPDFSTPIRWGAGVGVRYYSPIGLLRLDIATPINRRRGDSVVQFYISLGQAF